MKAVCFAAWFLLLASPAAADPAAHCEDLYVEADFGAARDCLARTLDRVSEEPDAISHAYALLAATELAAKREPEARRAIDVALAIDPSLDPEDPILRAPRVRALLSEARPGRDEPLVLRAQPPARLGRDAVRLAVDVDGLRSPLSVLLRYRIRGSSQIATGWRHAAMTRSEDGGGAFQAVLRRPSPQAAIDTQFVVQTPEGVTVRRVVGASIGPQALTPAPRPLRAAPHRPEPLVGGPLEPGRRREAPFVGTFAFWSLLAVGSAALVGLAALSQRQPPPLFRLDLR